MSRVMGKDGPGLALHIFTIASIDLQENEAQEIAPLCGRLLPINGATDQSKTCYD